MTLTETALKKLSKEEIITFTLYLQNNINQYLKCIKKRSLWIEENLSKIEAKVAVTKQVNNVLRNQMVQVEQKSLSNEQYSRPECLEIAHWEKLH